MTTSRRSFFSVLVGGATLAVAASAEARVEPAVDDVDSLLHEVYTDLHSLMTQLRDAPTGGGYENAGHMHSFSFDHTHDHMHTYSGTTWPTRRS